eukprot:gene8544-5991_t
MQMMQITETITINNKLVFNYMINSTYVCQWLRLEKFVFFIFQLFTLNIIFINLVTVSLFEAKIHPGKIILVTLIKLSIQSIKMNRLKVTLDKLFLNLDPLLSISSKNILVVGSMSMLFLLSFRLSLPLLPEGCGKNKPHGRGRHQRGNENEKSSKNSFLPLDRHNASGGDVRNTQKFKRGGMRGRGRGFQDPQDNQRQNLSSSVDPNNMTSWGKKELAGFIKAFRDSDEHKLIFPPTLDAKQRSIIHDICSVFDFHHESHGPKSERVLTITKMDCPGENQTITRGYRGAQLFPSLTCVKNSVDMREIKRKIDPLYQAMIQGIKVEGSKVHHRLRRAVVQQESEKHVSANARRDQAYWTLQQFRKTLPAFQHGKKVLDALRESDVAVVCGETGSGKTTQIPQMIHQSGIIPKDKTIICTQPRRISALSVAHRVSEELGEQCGNTCGYIIRFENETSRNTRIIYMTTGILLRRLQVDPELNGVGCVIVDEVHERDVETDFCLLLLRDRLIAQQSAKPTNFSLKVVIMSATIQIEKLRNYFSVASKRQVTAVNIPGTLHPVHEYFLEDAMNHIGETFSKTDKRKYETQKDISTNQGGNATYAQLHSSVFSESVEEMVPFNTVVKLILHCHQSCHDKSGSILVFLPGWAQITKIASMLKLNPASRDLWVLLLHSSLTSSEQQRVFQPPPQQYRKVVLATNIAETSITIDDVVWVIDSCLSKDTNYDPAGNVTSLKAVTIAKANGTQRRGRAGRCQKGVCYHLLPRETYHNLPDFLPPQMLRTSLEEICLQVKAITSNEKCVTVLQRAMDSPPIESIQHSVDFLTSMGVFTEDQERLTPLGAALAQLPIHPILGKMLFAATCFGVLDTIALIAASLSVKSPFMVPHPSDRPLAQKAIRSLDEGTLSDHFCVVRLFDNWVRGGRRADYAYENFADPNSLRLLERTKNQLKGLVLRSALVGHIKKDLNQVTSRYNHNKSLVRLVLLWSLYPRLATVEFRVKRPKLPNVVCWDGSPASVSNSSALMRRHRQDFGARTFLVFFERIFIETSLYLSEATAVSPIEVSLCMKHISVVPLAEVPPVLLRDVDSRFIAPFPYYVQEEVPDEVKNSSDCGLAAIFFDGGIKLYVAPQGDADLIQRVRQLIDYYLANAIVKLRADAFPDELIRIIGDLLGEPCTVTHQSTKSAVSEPAGFSHNPVGNHLYINEEGQLMLGMATQQPSHSPEDTVVADDDSDGDFEVIYEDEEEEEHTITTVLTETERNAALETFGDLVVLQKEDTAQMLAAAAVEAQRAWDAYKAVAEEEKAAATRSQEAKRMANARANVVAAIGNDDMDEMKEEDELHSLEILLSRRRLTVDIRNHFLYHLSIPARIFRFPHHLGEQGALHHAMSETDGTNGGVAETQRGYSADASASPLELTPGGGLEQQLSPQVYENSVSPSGVLPDNRLSTESTHSTVDTDSRSRKTASRPPPIQTVESAKNSSARLPAVIDPKVRDSYYVYLHRLTLIDTAEETTQWANRARHQWGGGDQSNATSGISIRVSSHTIVRGRTPPKPLQFSPAWTGVTWSKHDAGILVLLEEDALLVVEVVVVVDRPENSGKSSATSGRLTGSLERVLGMGIINAQAIVDEDRQWGKFCVHLLPSLCPLDSQTVHAVVELSIVSSAAMEAEEEDQRRQGDSRDDEGHQEARSGSPRKHITERASDPHDGTDAGSGEPQNGMAKSGRDLSPLCGAPSSLVAAATGVATSNPGGGDVGFTTLEFNYGAVRVSGVDFFYPPFFLSGTGQYIVSNVLCAMNMTESSSLAMQLVPLKEAREYLQTSPPSIITVRPQQRAYFTATWDLRKTAYRSGPRLELELLVHGSHTPTARILLQVHHTTPHSTSSDVPYMYWVNNTCLCNRPLISPDELPLLKEVLPVYRLVSSSRRWGGRGGKLPHAPSAPARFPSPLTASPRGPRQIPGAAGSSPSATLASPVTDGEDGALDTNASFVLSAAAREEMMSAAAEARRGEHPHPLSPSSNVEERQTSTRRVYYRGPLLNIQQRTCRCSLTLGPIRGFPFLESLTGQPNAFRIAVTLLDKVGWKVLVGETRPSYPTASGSLQWNETLWLQKWPGATHFQFCRLHLSEVRSSDGDETPIGAGLISLPSLSRIHECVPSFVAFSVYETYSQYDQMSSPSLLMKDMTLRFSDIR